MPVRRSPPTLYTCCMDYLIPIMEKYSRTCDWETTGSCQAMEKLPGPIATDLLLQSYRKANEDKTTWKKEWKIYYTSKIATAILCWDADLVEFISDQCHALQQIEVVQTKKNTLDLILKLPRNVATLDFDGELVRRGELTAPLMFQRENSSTSGRSWLPAAEEIFKALQILRRKPPEISPPGKTRALSELHLGTTPVVAADLTVVLENFPNLRLLRHYQLVTALYQLHADAWHSKKSLPKYKLRNFDVDFSHVVRCRMSPEWVLDPEALQLAVLLCPGCTSVRVRFDCSTPNYVLAPLLNLEKLKEFSAVCVSSGERTLLDFSDMTPILEKHGPVGLVFLELKVIEEVEIHIIIESCTKLESLVLSGCGYITPPTCGSFPCQSYAKGTFKRLKLLFFADGDDFSWDHGVPECFWKAALLPSGRSRTVQLEGLFLEFPRIPVPLAAEIFHAGRLPFPELQVLSLCRYTELTVEDVAAILGLRAASVSHRCTSLKYLRLSECEQVGKPEGKRLNGWMKQCDLGKVRLEVDR